MMDKYLNDKKPAIMSSWFLPGIPPDRKMKNDLGGHIVGQKPPDPESFYSFAKAKQAIKTEKAVVEACRCLRCDLDFFKEDQTQTPLTAKKTQRGSK